MTRDEFLTRLNVEAEKNLWERVTPRMIRRLVDARLMRGPKPIGRERGQHPDWQWSESSFQQALRICALRAQGLKRTSEIRFYLWRQYSDIPFDRPSDFQQLRRDVRKEFRRARNEMRRQSTSKFDLRSEKEISTLRAESITKKFGELSPLLGPLGFRYSDVQILPLSGSLLFGEHGTLKIGSEKVSLDTAISDVLNRFGLSKEMQSLVPEFPEMARGILSGLGGVPDQIEGSAEDAIMDADETMFNLARAISQTQLNSMTFTPDVLDAIDPAIDPAVGFRDIANFQLIPKLMNTRPWGIVIFVQSLLLACRNKNIAIELVPYMAEIEKIGMPKFLEKLRALDLPEKSQSNPDDTNNA